MFLKCVYFVCVGVLHLHICLCNMSGPGAYEGQKKALDSLGLEIQTVVSGCWELSVGPLEECPGLMVLKLGGSQETRLAREARAS